MRKTMKSCDGCGKSEAFEVCAPSGWVEVGGEIEPTEETRGMAELDFCSLGCLAERGGPVIAKAIGESVGPRRYRHRNPAKETP